MIQSANRDIQRDAATADLRHRRAARLPALLAALDDMLNELEELNVRGITEAPDECRRRAAELIAKAVRPSPAPAPPRTVAGLMERVYEAEDMVLLMRRRSAWGLE